MQTHSRIQYAHTLLSHAPTSQHLANVAWALAKLGSRPSSEWLGAFEEAAFRALPQFKPQELTNTLWALAVLNYRPDSVGWECSTALARRYSLLLCGVGVPAPAACDRSFAHALCLFLHCLPSIAGSMVLCTFLNSDIHC